MGLGRAGSDESRRGDEILKRAAIARAVRFEVDGHEPAIGPVQDVKGLLVFRGKLRALAVADSGRAADADVHDGSQAVGVVIRPFAGAVAPAEFRTGDGVVHAGGAIPGDAPVVFHVRIEREQFAIHVESEVELVAKTGAEEIELGGVFVHAQDVAAGCHDAGRVAVPIRLAWQDVIFVVILVGRIG